MPDDLTPEDTAALWNTCSAHSGLEARLDAIAATLATDREERRADRAETREDIAATRQDVRDLRQMLEERSQAEAEARIRVAEAELAAERARTERSRRVWSSVVEICTSRPLIVACAVLMGLAMILAARSPTVARWGEAAIEVGGAVVGDGASMLDTEQP